MTINLLFDFTGSKTIDFVPKRLKTIRKPKIIMNVKEILDELKEFGNESTKKTLMKHGAKEPVFGVKVADLKKILKKIKGEQQLALDLYQTGNSDAMYLAGLAADGSRMSKVEIQDWAEKAYWSYLSEYTVPWVASENEDGWKIGLKWIESKKENIAAAGWSTLGMVQSLKDDADLDIGEIKSLVKRVEKEIPSAQNRVRYTMNGYLISVAAYVVELTDFAIETSERIGKVQVDMNGTACKVPYPPIYIEKIKARGPLGKKKKAVKC